MKSFFRLLCNLRIKREGRRRRSVGWSAGIAFCPMSTCACSPSPPPPPPRPRRWAKGNSGAWRDSRAELFYVRLMTTMNCHYVLAPSPLPLCLGAGQPIGHATPTLKPKRSRACLCAAPHVAFSEVVRGREEQTSPSHNPYPWTMSVTRVPLAL